MPVPPELEAVADMLAIQENPLNGHQITSGGPIQGGGSPASLALPIGTMWQNGRTLRVKILNGSDKIKEKIRQYAMVWTQYANIKFSFVDSGDAEIRVNVDMSGASWSYVGTNNLSIPSTRHTMNFGWLTDLTAENEYSRVIIHEFGHALGCIYEHQSPAAGIPWNKELVYKYYSVTQSWTKEQTDQNMFALYEASTTQFSAFDPSSIMLYAIPESLTTNGYHTGWNRELSETDKAFIAQVYPGATKDTGAGKDKGAPLATGTFNTLELRPWTQPYKDACKGTYFPAEFPKPPTVVAGLTWLDIGNDDDIRVKTYVDAITTKNLDVHLDTWAGTKLYSAGCTWYATAKDSDIQAGQFSTVEDHPWDKPQTKTSRQIKFERPYSKVPKVVLWLSQLNMARDKNWRVSATATDVSATGFTLNLDTWADSVLYMATASWIAYPSDMSGIVSGSYSTNDVRNWSNPQLINGGRADFPSGVFEGTPKVLLGISSIDIDKKAGLRLKLSADSVSAGGMNWHIDSWADAVLYAAGASYIAFA